MRGKHKFLKYIQMIRAKAKATYVAVLNWVCDKILAAVMKASGTVCKKIMIVPGGTQFYRIIPLISVKVIE